MTIANEAATSSPHPARVAIRVLEQRARHSRQDAAMHVREPALHVLPVSLRRCRSTFRDRDRSGSRRAMRALRRRGSIPTERTSPFVAKSLRLHPRDEHLGSGAPHEACRSCIGGRLVRAQLGRQEATSFRALDQVHDTARESRQKEHVHCVVRVTRYRQRRARFVDESACSMMLIKPRERLRTDELCVCVRERGGVRADAVVSARGELQASPRGPPGAVPAFPAAPLRNYPKCRSLTELPLARRAAW